MVSSQLVHGQFTVCLLGKVSFASLQKNEHAKATDVEASTGNVHKNIWPKSNAITAKYLLVHFGENI